MLLLNSLVLAFAATYARADELLMFYSPYCPHCARFMDDVVLDADPYHGEIPLTIINMVTIDESDPNYWWIRKAYSEGRLKGIHYTPTFVVWIGDHETGRESERFVGYINKEDFYKRLHAVMEAYKGAHPDYQPQTN